MKAEKIVNESLTSAIYDLAIETELARAPRLSRALKCPILLKREDQQPVFSFKIRGAYHKMLKLDAEQRKRGVVAASAGNHAQGVAISANKLGIPAHIFMPQTVQQLKVEAVQSYGAITYLKCPELDLAVQQAMEFAKKKKMPFFHPFDDYDVIAGQGTMGAELLRQISDPIEAVFICTGGGGLLAGVATVIKSLRPKTKVYGVEPHDAASMAAALRAGRPVLLPYVGRFAETVAVRKVGSKTFGLCKQFVDGVIEVDTASICSAIKDIYEDTRTIIEPSGALGVAAARKYVESGQSKGGALVCVLSGANMNFDMLRHIVERATSGSRGEMILGATIPEKPRSFLRFCNLLGKRSVTEFNYRYAGDSDAHVFAGIELSAPEERKQIIDSLRKAGIEAVDLTGDENAELHIRHMIGGRAHLQQREHVFRFEFPERAGALANFLKHLKPHWNISMFHYRFHGADYGRVLAGFQVPDSELKQLHEAFEKIGYTHWSADDSLAYQMFLADPKGNSRPKRKTV